MKLLEEVRLFPTVAPRLTLLRLQPSAQMLVSLKDRRSKLIPERFRLADHKRDLDSVVARLAITDRDADGFEVASNVTPTQRAEAKHRADQITAKYETRCKQLADVEAAIAAYEKEAA